MDFDRTTKSLLSYIEKHGPLHAPHIPLNLRGRNAQRLRSLEKEGLIEYNPNKGWQAVRKDL